MRKKSDIIEDVLFAANVIRQQEEIIETIIDVSDCYTITSLLGSVLTELNEARRLLENGPADQS